jgi:hypothetical protein
MSRFRLFMLGLLAVLAFGVVGSASASADSCTGGSNLVYCASPGNTPLTGTSVLGLGGLSLLSGTIGGASAKFHCPDVHFTGTLGNLGASTGLLQFLNCKEEAPANCKLKAGQEKEIDAKVIGQQTSATAVTFTGAGTGELFATLEVEGASCVATGSFPVTGSQLAETPTGGEGKVEQEIVAKKSGSMMKLGPNTASFSSSVKAMVASGSAWLVMTAGI